MVVSFYYQGYRLLIFYTFQTFFNSISMDGFESREGVTIFEGNRRSGTEEVAPYAALFLCLRVA